MIWLPLSFLVVFSCGADEFLESLRKESISHFSAMEPVGEQCFNIGSAIPFQLPVGCQNKEVIDPKEEFVIVAEEIEKDPFNFIANSQEVEKTIEITEETAGESVSGVLHIRKEESFHEESSEESYTVCLGHKVSSSVYNPNNWIRDQEARYRSGTAEWECWKSGNASAFKNKKRDVWCRWKHHVNDAACSNKEKKIVITTKMVKKEEWTPCNAELLKAVQGAPLAVILKDIDVSPTERKLIYERVPQPVSLSQRPSGLDCTLLSRDCIDQDTLGCLRWSRRLHCQYRVTERENLDWMKPSPLAQDEPIDNAAFTKATLQFTLLNEIKESVEAGNPLFFVGESLECSKSSFGSILDCCQRKGVAVDLYLKECSTSELKLSEMKQRGLCHFVGTYKVNDGLGLSRTKSSYCCFSSKLVRVFQEQIREQLSLTWGEGSHPDCRGLSVGEFARVDLDKIDLSAAIDAPPEIPEAEVKKRVEGFLETIDSKMDGLKKSEEWKRAYSYRCDQEIFTTVPKQLILFFGGYCKFALTRIPSIAPCNAPATMKTPKYTGLRPSICAFTSGYSGLYANESTNLKEIAPTRAPTIAPNTTSLPFQDTFSGEEFSVVLLTTWESIFKASAFIKPRKNSLFSHNSNENLLRKNKYETYWLIGLILERGDCVYA